jgi:hypothetical protein
MTAAQASEYIAFIQRAAQKTLARMDLVWLEGQEAGGWSAGRFQEFADLNVQLRALKKQYELACDLVTQTAQWDHEQMAARRAQVRAAKFAAQEERQRRQKALRVERYWKREALRRRQAREAREAKCWAEAVVCNCRQCRGELPPIVTAELPVPVTPLRSGGDVHCFPDEIERRARAMEYWTPWGKRRTRSSRRYEGFYGQGR